MSAKRVISVIFHLVNTERSISLVAAPLVEILRNYRIVDSPNVKKAKGLVEDLSSLKDQVKTLAEEKEKWSQVSFTEPPIKQQTKADDTVTSSHVNLSHTGPAPLDSYLKMPEQEPCSPYKTVPDMSYSQFNAPILPHGFKDAESILKQVQKHRGILEANLETVYKGRKDVEVYSVLETLYNDSSNKEVGHIQKMVDNAITKLRREVEREVTDDVVIAAVKKKQQTSVPGAVNMPEPAPAKPAGKYGYRSRLDQRREPPKVEPKKQPVKKPAPSRPQFKKPAKSLLGDEATMTQVYGKASYQKGRTTVKDPYLHFQNTAKPKPPRPAAVKEVKGTEVMSSKTQTGPGAVRQFYFNPNTGTYIPIASMANAAPIPGQLIPMAVPLGGPRIDSGLSVPTHLPQGQIPQVTAAGNVAMVSVGTDEPSKKHGHIPELGKQVLPAVDIDTDISEMSDVVEERASSHRSSHQTSHMTSTTPIKQKKSVQIITPRESPEKTPGRYEVIYHEDEEPVVKEEGGEERKNSNSSSNSRGSFTQSIRVQDNDRHSDDTIVDEDDDVETATGVELPGYQPVETPEVQYNGPSFPPKQPSTDRQFTSELIAEDIRRRDMMQNQATDWLEQELMARIITEIYPLKDKEEPAEISHMVSETSEDSMAEENEKSMFVMDSIGHRGMQLFIDAGYPVDNSLVNNLVKEVLAEKVRTMLGQRPDREDLNTAGGPDRAEDQYEQDWEEPVSEDIEEPAPHAQTVMTPEPTPRASPVSSPPPRQSSVPLTPPASPRLAPKSPRQQEIVEPEVYLPPAQPLQPQQPMYEPESEPESSASYDIKEEMNRLAEQLHPQMDVSASVRSKHDIATPPESPKPEPEPFIGQPLTPPDLSPRPVEEGFTMSQRVMQAGMSAPRGRGSPHVSKSDTPKSPTSGQISGDMPEEVMDDQPRPVVFTVAETQTEIVDETRKPRSPSPARDKSRSRSPSESSITESSSISDTFNENISEGQWLVNKSDGEIADFPVDPNVVRNRILHSTQKRVDVSSASTWKDADEIDLEEMTDVSKSEGEFLYRTDMPPEKDPVLHLLARLQHDAPQYGLYNLSNRQVTDVLNNTGKSEGEVIRVAPSQQQQQQQVYSQEPSRPFYKPQQQQQTLPFQQQQQQPRVESVRSKSPRAKIVPSQPQRTRSPSFRTQSPTRVSFEDEAFDPRPSSPTRGILKMTSSYDSQRRAPREEDFDRPVRDSGRSVTPTGRITPGGRQPQGKGMISAGGRTSPMKSRSKPPQVIRSTTLPDSRSSGARFGNVRGSSDDYRDSLDNTGGASYFGTGSEHGTRTMTPDQMNMDALIQSGYLSQSFSQSENGKQPGRSSVRSSGDLGLSRTSASGGSLGLSYGTNGSLGESELQRLATHGTGKLKMSLTLPGADAVDESDLSEFDLSAK